jgi:hypothetical protein
VNNQNVEQAARNAVKEEIGDAENLTFKQKAILNQKFGVIPAFVTLDEQAFWESKEDECLPIYPEDECLPIYPADL